MNFPTTTNSIKTPTINPQVDDFTRALTSYLADLGLPTDNVLVPVCERTKLINNFPDVLNLLPFNNKNEYLYLSKFIAACGIGLFDAALNFLWDETVLNLRNKIVNFDLQYFLESAISDPEKRKKIKNADNLDEIDDWELIRGCHLTGILSEIGFKHLDYIRDMRNWVSAAHPNQNQITGLQLVAWLETCIKEVIGKEPEAPALEVKKLLSNVRNSILTNDLILHINHSMEKLPSDILTSLLKTLFGMYTDKKSSTEIKANIKGIVQKCWELSTQNSKYECGLKYAAFAANGDADRTILAKEFLSLVDGLAYLPTDALALELSEKINNLYLAHTRLNNFYNKPIYAKVLSKYIPDNGDIPTIVRFQYVKVIIMARIGNGYGTSWHACAYYDKLIGKFTEQEIIELTKLFTDSEFSSRIRFSSCVEAFKEIVAILLPKTTNQISRQILNSISEQTSEQLTNLGKDSRYNQDIKKYN